jgi:hypothetical protein
MKISEQRVREIIIEELLSVMSEAKDEDGKTSSQISAASETLKKAIDAFDAEKLPDVPSELTSALASAKKILSHMSDNPGQYKGGMTNREGSESA